MRFRCWLVGLLALIPFLLVVNGCQPDKPGQRPSTGTPESLHQQGASSSAGHGLDTGTPEPLPPEIVTAWQKVGAEVGWMGSRATFDLWNFDEREDIFESSTVVPAFRFTPNHFGKLNGLPDTLRPFGLQLAHTRMTNAGLKELAALKNLTILNLEGTEVTDTGLKELAALKKLTALSLSDTEVTDAGVKELAALQNLTSLDLSGANVTDAGLKELASWPHCKTSPD